MLPELPHQRKVQAFSPYVSHQHPHICSYLCLFGIFVQLVGSLSMSIEIRDGHAYAEYTVYADYAHMREYADADAGENLIHIIHI